MKTISLLACLILLGCDHTDDKLIVKNELDYSIHFVFSSDTILDSSELEAGFDKYYKIQGQTNKHFMAFGGRNPWEGSINMNPDKKLHSFVFKGNQSGFLIADSSYFLGRIDMSLDDLRSTNWVIQINDSTFRKY